MKKILFFCLLAVLVSAATAQNSAGGVEMAERFYSEGKIYVVLAVILIILTGLFLYLVSIDRKLSRMEKGDSN